MTPLNRRDRTITYIDDQSPLLQNSYVGNWTRYKSGNYTKYNGGTYTATPSPGASFSFAFFGTQAWLYGGLLDANVTQDGRFITYPTANYLVDGNLDNSQVPSFTSDKTILYFQTPSLEDGLHTVNLTVTSANETNPFIIDWYYFQSDTGTNPSSATATSPPDRHPGHVGAIVGGVVGCLAVIALLIIALFYILRRSRGNRGGHVEKPDSDRAISDGYRAEPFDPTVLTQNPSAEASRPADPNGSSNMRSSLSPAQSSIGAPPAYPCD